MRVRVRGGGWKVCAAFLLWISLFGGAEHARADGKFYPSRSMLEQPSIPYQRALILHRDGEQTLVVESSMKGEPGEYGWLLPVPAVPHDFGTVSPRIFGNLSVVTSPHRWKPILSAVLCIVLLFACLAVVLGVIRPRIWSREGSGLPCFFLIAFLLLFFFLMTGPLSADRMQGTGDGVTVHARKDVGLHDVAVLEAKAPEALDAWLDANGFQGIPPEQTAIVESYIDSGWVFVATRFNAPAMDVATPDPLRITFPTETPVYPMRLTRAAVTEEGLHLTLFVVADGAFGHPELDTEFADRFSPRVPGSDGGDAGAAAVPVWDAPHYAGAGYGGVVGHPDLLALLWDGCVVTRLSGTVPPERMEEDFWLEPGGRGPQRSEFFATHEVNALQVLETVPFFLHILLWGGLFLVLVLPQQAGKESRARICLFLILVLYAGGVALVFGGLFPTLSTHRSFVDANKQLHRMHRHGMFPLSSIEQFVREGGGQTTLEEARTRFLENVWNREAEMGIPDLDWIEDDRGVVIRQYCPVRYVPLDLVLSDPDAFEASRMMGNKLLSRGSTRAGGQFDSTYPAGVLGMAFSILFIAGFLLLWQVSGKADIDGKARRVGWMLLVPFLVISGILLFFMTRGAVVFAPFVALGYFDGDAMVLVSLCMFAIGALFGGVGRRVWERMCAGG